MMRATDGMTGRENNQSLSELITRARAVIRDESLAAAERLRRTAAILRMYACLSGLEVHGEIPDTRKAGGLAAWQIQRVQAFIRTNLEKALSVPELASLAPISPSHF